MSNLQEQVWKTFCYQKLFWPFTVRMQWIVLVISKILQFSAFSLEFQKYISINRTFFLTIGQNNFGNKIPNLNEILTITWNIFFNVLHRNHSIIWNHLYFRRNCRNHGFLLNGHQTRLLATLSQLLPSDVFHSQSVEFLQPPLSNQILKKYDFVSRF